MRTGISLLLLSIFAAPATATPRRDPRIEAHVVSGWAHYANDEFEPAIAEFEYALAAHPEPRLLFAVGRCHDRLGHLALAADAYRAYLATTDDEEGAPEIRARVRAIEDQLGRKHTAIDSEETGILIPTVPPIAYVAPPRIDLVAPPPRRKWTAPLLVGGLTVALAGVGTALVVSVAPDYAALESRCHPCAPSDYADVQLRANLGYAVWGLAGATAIADVVLWAMAARKRRAPSLVATFAGVQGTF
jgi:tetratricopeptide (TPR) repeat protein